MECGTGKNIITNNNSITTYDIYNSGKIVYLDDLYKMNKISFSNSKYSVELIDKYQIQNWVKKIFLLQ